ncbi:MAG: MBL fold metallo-hydrolase RNA specificity domain-containing protein [Wenzhouxiangella sp.]|jgi:metallo-beta-lactamase family protein|nr:MBL fold metallo-hydrolase RNA specificity domain-containing protein [Wenzhouxiangella sp.]
MAIRVTEVYERWLELLDSVDVRALGPAPRASLEGFLPTLSMTPESEQSMGINRIQSGAFIIAGSGMCTGGRSRHHFKHRIWNACNTILFAGFQARGTLGRLLVDGVRRIQMFGDEYAVKAQIATLGGLSAHAGQSELMEWAAGFGNHSLTVLVHGEPKAQQALAYRLQEELGGEFGPLFAASSWSSELSMTDG